MRQSRIISFVENKTFKPTIGNNERSFKVSLKQEGGNIKAVNFSESKNIDVDVDMSKGQSQINPTMDVSGGVIDEYYDEIIFYDGGGVEGYGY